MRLECYSVYDKAVDAFMQPFFVRAKGEALRSFMDACSDGKSQFVSHPEDYTLFHVGTWDEDIGVFSVPDGGPQKLITALECVAVSKKEKGGN